MSFKVKTIACLSFFFFIQLSYCQKVTIKNSLESSLMSSEEAKILLSQYEIIKMQREDFSKRNLPTLSLSLNAPNFNQSFYEVTQPDGSVAFREQNSASSSLSLQLSQKVPFTGGNLSIGNSLNRLDQFGNIESTSYSASWLNISFNQPLNFFNSYRWQSNIDEAQYLKQELDIKNNLIQLKIKTVEHFFSVIRGEVNKATMVKDYQRAKKIRELTLEKVKAGEMSMVDSLNAEIYLLETEFNLENEKQQVEVSKTLFFEQVKFEGLSKQLVNFVIPELPFNGYYDMELLRKKFISNHFNILKDNSIQPLKKDVLNTKSQRGFQSNLTFSYGLNNSDENLGLIFNKPTRRASINLSFNLPILDWGKSRRIFESSNEKLKIGEAEMESLRFNKLAELSHIVNELIDLKKRINVVLKKRTLNSMKLENAQKLLEYNYITIDELIDVNKDNLNTNNEYLRLLLDSWVNYFELQLLTQYDLAKEKDLMIEDLLLN